MDTSKINFCEENIDSSKNYKSTRRGGIGTRILSLMLAASVAAGVTNLMARDTSLTKGDIENSSCVFSTTTDDVNGLNIIINDGDCSNSFFSEVTDILKDDGLRFDTTDNFQDINKDGATVISLDQQYSSGADTVIFAPYNNARIGNSDSLAICMQSAFKQNGISVEEISCGQVGFQKDENGNVSYMVPTATEKAIDDDKDASFVTISLGTNTNNASSVAKSIENGLVRQYHYLQEIDAQTDLIYRASKSDDLDVVADYFGTTSRTLAEANNLDDGCFIDSQTIINPDVKNKDVFKDSNFFYLKKGNTKSY